MSLDCILCCDQTKLFGITQCNHGPFCYRCMYKMRVINKNNTCPICKHESKQIMISEQYAKFGSYKGDILPDANFGDVFHCGKQAKKQFEKLKEYKCFIKINGKPCKFQKSFDNIAFLKKHLKQEHKRVLCDICLEKKTCVLEEQKLYTVAQLNKHMQRGDIDDFGNVIFMHPFCSFCKQYFFDEDEFRRHMNLEHMICNVCGPQHKYIYYKDYQGLETHYKISHYICSDPSCMAKKFIAFRTAEELKIHRTEAHTAGNKKIDGKQLCGFNYGGIVTDQEIELKDKQGINMQDQFLTLKKSKNRAIGEADKQQDAIIDVRDFYPCQQDEQQHFRDSFILKHKNKNQDEKSKQVEQIQTKGGKNKKKYIEKQQFEKQKPTFAKQNEQFTIQQLNLIKSLHLPKLHYDDFEDKLATLLSNDDLKKLQSWRVKNNKRQLTPEHFIQNFYDLMRKVSLKTGYQIFPHYIRTVPHEDTKEQLDYEYVKTLKKIPTKTPCMLSSCKTYGQLFKKLLHEIQINIEKRIRDQTLSIKKPIRRQKQRLFQLIGVVRRLKTQEMAKFKFASNFGVQLDTSQMIQEKIFKMNEENIQSRLSKVPNEEFIDLYVFVKYCYEAITHSENMHLSKNKIHEHVLQDYLFDRPELDKAYGPKKQDLKTLEQKVQFQKEQQQKTQKKRLKDIEKKNKDMGYHSKANFSLNDKNDFPDLDVNKKTTQTNNFHENFRDVVDTAKSKPATYQKKINELFPSLGEPQNKDDDQNKKKDSKLVAEKKEKAWWEKINEPKNADIQEEQQVVKIRKGRGKNQKFVAAKGFFGH